MKDIFPIEFEYGQKQYFGIVRTWQKEAEIELHVQIMNGRIHRLFYGHHTFIIKDNHIVAEEAGKGKVAILRNCIRHCIEQRLIS